MATGTQVSVKEKLAGKAGAVATQENRPKTLEDEVRSFVQKYAALLPSTVTPERMLSIALNEYRQTVKLKDCTAVSFYGSVIKALQLGLEPGVLGHCYLLPFRNNRSGKHEVQFVLGYKGMLELIRRSGQVLSIVARPVYEGDKLTLSYGIEDKFEHVPYSMIEGAEKGKFKGVTLKAIFKDGGYLTDYMPVVEIEEHRKRSLAKDSGPWKTDYEAMALKTIIRKNFKWLPVSVETQKSVVESDETTNRITDDISAIDVDYTMVEPETGEIPMTAEEAEETAPTQEGEASKGEGLFASEETK